MKKLLGIIISLLMFVPMVVLADMGSPVIREIKFIVNNPDGVPIYIIGDNDNYVKTDEIVKYKTVLTTGDYDELAGKYIQLMEIDEDGDEIGSGKYVYIGDLELYNADYKVNEKELSKKEKALVLKDSVIRKGPAEIYDSTGVTIMAGTEVDVRFFAFEDGTPDVENVFVYVDYKGTKGFICTYYSALAFERNTYNSVFFYADTEVYDPITEKPVGVIKANTNTKLDLMNVDPWSHSFYAEYNGMKGLIDEDAVLFKDDKPSTVTVRKDINIYEKLSHNFEKDINNLKVVAKLKKGDTFETYYSFDYQMCIAYYDKNGIKGWAYSEYEDVDDDYGSMCLFGIDYYDDEDDESEEPTDDIEAIPDDENDPEPYEPYIIPRRDNSMDILYLCIAAAAIIAMTAVVTITYVNKKNKNKVEEKK